MERRYFLNRRVSSTSNPLSVAGLAVSKARPAALRAIYDYFSPDFEESFIKGYKRPAIGLKLCWRCMALKYRLWGKVTHHPSYQHLRSSIAKGCWLCQTVDYQWGVALQDYAQPPVLTEPSELRMGRTPRLLLWFADNTVTATGYLDQLKGSSTSPVIIVDLSNSVQIIIVTFMVPNPGLCKTILRQKQLSISSMIGSKFAISNITATRENITFLHESLM